ncbi:hypothetical protein VNI00_015521 [Paramarasmius palmivorus]|uniref:Uncharacterized protein n=1 Tax=Paramarasmius palmivorus TaxID=297713 RepID=A0AAW0BKM0_9AGAR
MDSSFYDFNAAAQLLAKVVDKRSAVTGNSQLAGIAQAAYWPSDVQIVEAGTPKAYHLVSYDDGQPEELVFRLQGVLVAKEMPPVEKPLGR